MNKKICFVFALVFVVLLAQNVSAALLPTGMTPYGSLSVLLVAEFKGKKTWNFHNHSLNVSDNIVLAGNLTLGQKITFALGGIISRKRLKIKHSLLLNNHSL